jgi:hypothetical protein
MVVTAHCHAQMRCHEIIIREQTRTFDRTFSTLCLDCGNGRLVNRRFDRKNVEKHMTFKKWVIELLNVGLSRVLTSRCINR